MRLVSGLCLVILLAGLSLSTCIEAKSIFQPENASDECIQGTCDAGKHCLNNTCVDESEEVLCGPGEEFEVSEDGNTVRVRPYGTALRNCLNIQRAVRTVSSGGTVELCEGEFNLGARVLTRNYIRIRKGLTMKGKYIQGEWLTVIRGGGGIGAFLPDPTVGPFWVSSGSDPNPVIFDGVWIRDWISEGIYVRGCNGFTFTRSRITDPISTATGYGFPFILTNFIHGLMFVKGKSQGELRVTHSDFDMTRNRGTRQSDGNAISLYGFPSCAFTLILIENNKIKTPDEAVEIFANDPEESSEFLIRNNEIDIDFDVKGIWFDHFAFLIAANSNTDRILIERNSVRLRNENLRNIKDLGVFGLTGSNFVVRENSIELLGEDGFNGNIFRIGNLAFGVSLFDSLVENNTITGTYNGAGVVFTNGRRNRSRNNTFNLGLDFANSAKEYTIVIEDKSKVCENTWLGDTGQVDGEIGRSCDSVDRRALRTKDME